MSKAPRINPIDLIRHNARRLVVMPPDPSGVRLVYAITHARTVSLMASAVAEVKGLADAAARAEHHANRLARCKTDEERARVEAEHEAQERLLNGEVMAELTNSPQKQLEYIELCSKMISQSVEAVGIANDEATEGPQPYGTAPQDVCVPLDEAETVYMRPLRVVLEGSADRDKGEVSINDYAEPERMGMAGVFMSAFSVKTAVSPLPGAPADPRVGGQDGQAVRSAPEHVPTRPRKGGGSARRSR